MNDNISELHEKVVLAEKEISKVVVGQVNMVNRILVGLFTNGHILLEGVPGLAKTLAVSTLAEVVDLDFNRIQFTPDLLPSDLVGTMIFNPKSGEFQVKKGPIFSNLILADEINRAPAKVQSALLEAMQEKQVTIGEETYMLSSPFLVLATQNPVEQEGTYPLPEAQIDRFLMKVNISHLTKAEELEVMKRMSTVGMKYRCEKILAIEDILNISALINTIQISDSLEKYIIELVFATRVPKEYGLKDEAMYISYGVSPRATIGLHKAARCLAFMKGRDYVLPEDIKEIASDILSHRIVLNYEAEADGVNTRQIIDAILNKVPIGK